MKKRALAIHLALAASLLGGAPAFVPGEWLVTLRDSSPLRSALEQAPPEAYAARLAEMADRLSQVGRVPLRAGASAGGGTWVVHADVERTLAELEQRLAARAGVLRVLAIPSERTAFWGIRSDRTLRVELRPDADAAGLRESLQAEEIPLLPAVPFDGGMTVRVDWPRLTRVVSERLAAHPEVRSVELNAIAEPHSGAESPAPATTSCS